MFDTIVKGLKSKNMDMTKTCFTSFYDISVTHEELNNVSTKFGRTYSGAILFIHSPGHVL